MNISKSKVIIIETIFSLENSYIAADKTPIRPIRLSEDKLDPQALLDYENFVSTVFGLLGSHHFEDVRYDISPKSETSHYIWFYPTNKDGSRANRFVIKFRLSDHTEKPQSPEIARRKRYYNQKIANKLKDPSDKAADQRYLLRGIVVNNTFFKDYDEAELKVDELFDRIEKQYTDR